LSNNVPGCPYPALVEMDQGGKFGNPCVQIIFEEADGTTTAWRVPPKVTTAEELREAVRRAGHAGKKAVWYLDAEDEGLRSLILQAWPQGRADHMGFTEAGTVLKVESVWRIEQVHARAIAMLAFHLFLALYTERGDGEQFVDIRRVICDDADPESHVRHEEAANYRPTRDGRPKQAKHLALIGVAPEGELIVDLRLFADAAGFTPWWRVLLAREVSRAQVQQCAIALAYFEKEPREVDGRILDGEILRLEFDGDALVVPSGSHGLS
jgi:hypothetical protein